MGAVNESIYKFDTGILKKDACIVIVYTEWNDDIVDVMLEGCMRILQKFGMANVKRLKVPGAFELPFAIKHCWDTYHNKFEKPAVFITLGCVIKGGTPHFEYVCKGVTDGIMHLNVTLPAPVIFGVLTVDDRQQALDRIGGDFGHKGEEAAYSALKMLSLNYSFS